MRPAFRISAISTGSSKNSAAARREHTENSSANSGRTKKSCSDQLNSFHFKRETGFEPATPTLARLYSTPEPLAHFSFFILLSARCTLQMILYRNSPHLSTLIFNFFQKNQKTSTIHPIFALLADLAALPPSPPSDLAWLRTCDAGTKPHEIVRPFSSTPSESRSAHTGYSRSFSAKYPRV